MRCNEAGPDERIKSRIHEIKSLIEDENLVLMHKIRLLIRTKKGKKEDIANEVKDWYDRRSGEINRCLDYADDSCQNMGDGLSTCLLFMMTIQIRMLATRDYECKPDQSNTLVPDDVVHLINESCCHYEMSLKMIYDACFDQSGLVECQMLCNPVFLHNGIINYSLDSFERNLSINSFQMFFIKFSREKLVPNSEWMNYVAGVNACLDYIGMKINMFRDLFFQLRNIDHLYFSLVAQISDMAKKIKHQCMDYMIFRAESVNLGVTPSSLINALCLDYQRLYLSERFLKLPLHFQNYLQHETRLQLQSIARLIPVFREISLPFFGAQASDFVNAYIARPWEAGLENYFRRKWQETAEREKQDWNYWGIRKALSGMTRNCLGHHVTESPQLLLELRNIYVKAERIRKSYLDEFEAKTRRLSITPYVRESGRLSYHGMMVEALSRWESMPGLIPQLLLEFREVLREPGKHTHCLWMVVTSPPDERMLESVPTFFNFAYVLVKTNHWRDKNTLYFLDKEKGLIEKIDLSRWKGRQEVLEEFLCTQGSPRVLTEEETFFITDLTGHSHDRRLYLYCILLKLLAYRVSGIMWGVWERNIDCEPEEWITSRMACTMAQEEMDRLCKRISLPYHPDRPYGSERTQIFLVQKRDEAKQRIDHFLNVQQELAQQHDLDIQRTQCVPVELARFIPRWIIPHGVYSHPGEEKKLVVNFCKVAVCDKVIEKNRRLASCRFTFALLDNKAVDREEKSEEGYTVGQKKAGI